MCGIFGYLQTTQSSAAAENIFLGLQNLQHRGQDGAGIVTSDGQQLFTHHGLGLMDIAFPKSNFEKLQGSIGIGHTRYATVGKQDIRQLQPFYNNLLTVAHNGNIVNYLQLMQDLADEAPQSGCDSEVILTLLSQALKINGESETGLLKSIEAFSQKAVGSYSVVGILQGVGLFAFRDPLGFRPLLLGKKQPHEEGESWAIASESVALEFLQFEVVGDIAPGEFLLIRPDGSVFRSHYTESKPRHCMFEWVYFSRVESQFDSIPVYQARFNLGVSLAEAIQKKGLLPDVVVPIPETSRIAAIAIAEKLNVPFREVLIKNRYVNRTFILESQAARLDALKRKLYPVRSELAGKKVLVVDDSIVRGNTALSIMQTIREAGATEIYLASTCPPIQHPCFYGIDFPDANELVAAKYPVDDLADFFGIDDVIFQTLDGLKTALSHQPICHACLSGEYPTDISAAARFSSMRSADRDLQEVLHVS